MTELDRPFLTDCSADPADFATDGIVEMLRLGGIEMFSMSALARWASRTRSTIHQRYGSSAEFVVTVVARFGRRWVEWVTAPGYEQVSPVRLPHGPHEVDGARAWQVMRLVADGERRAGRPAASAYVEDALAAERRHIAEHLARRLGRDALAREVEYVVALAEGLRQRITAHDAALSVGEAEAMLRSHLVENLGLPLGVGDLDMDELAVFDRVWRDRPAI